MNAFFSLSKNSAISVDLKSNLDILKSQFSKIEGNLIYATRDSHLNVQNIIVEDISIKLILFYLDQSHGRFISVNVSQVYGSNYIVGFNGSSLIVENSVLNRGDFSSNRIIQ